MTDWAGIQQRLINGSQLAEAEALELAEIMPEELPQLLETAGEITRHYFQKRVSLCAILPAKTGRCSGDCAFCAQSAHHNCRIEIRRVEDIDVAQTIEHIRHMQGFGVSRFSFVTSGEALTEREFIRVLRIYEQLRTALAIDFCASLGALTPERARQLKEAGVSRYHHNLETSRSFFSQICTTHSYESKIQTILEAKAQGMQVCSGGIISLGENLRQRLEMALELRRLNVDCVPVNILNPIPGTRLQHQPLLSAEEIFKTIAFFRLILPQKSLRFAGGRENALAEQEERGYLYGIDSAIFGNYLTTRGRGYEDGLRQLQELGFSVSDEHQLHQQHV